MEKEILKRLIDKKLSQREIGNLLNLSQTTIRYWLHKYKLKTIKISNNGKINKYICKNCGKEIYDLKSKRKFCNLKCKRIFNLKETYEKIKQGKPVAPSTLRRVLLFFRKNACSICTLELWNNQPIPLILDHIDGNSENNNLSNLRFICPNCDALLPTYKNRNKGNGRHKRRQRYKKGLSY